MDPIIPLKERKTTTSQTNNTLLEYHGRTDNARIHRIQVYPVAEATKIRYSITINDHKWIVDKEITTTDIYTFWDRGILEKGRPLKIEIRSSDGTEITVEAVVSITEEPNKKTL